jgi:hypothetical protein
MPLDAMSGPGLCAMRRTLPPSDSSCHPARRPRRLVKAALDSGRSVRRRSHRRGLWIGGDCGRQVAGSDPGGRCGTVSRLAGRPVSDEVIISGRARPRRQVVGLAAGPMRPIISGSSANRTARTECQPETQHRRRRGQVSHDPGAALRPDWRVRRLRVPSRNFARAGNARMINHTHIFLRDFLRDVETCIRACKPDPGRSVWRAA